MFRFEPKAESPEIGNVYPQISEVTLGYDMDGPQGFAKYFSSPFGNVDGEIDLDCFVLSEQANPTDLISSSFLGVCGHIVSPKLSKLLAKFSLAHIEIFDIGIYYHGDYLEGYKFLFFKQPSLEVVNFGKSKFLKKSILPRKSEEIQVRTLNDYLKFEKQLGSRETINADPLVFEEKIEFDFFTLGRLFHQTIVSERLKEALILENITGVKISRI